MIPRATLPPLGPAALALALGLALGLRVWGIGWGLPDGVEPDEPKMVHHALAFGLGDLDPHYYHYPHLPMYLLFACYGLLFVVLTVTGRVEGVAGFKTLFLTDPSIFYEVGRGLVTAFALGAVVLVWRLGRRAYGSTLAGALAAFSLAVLPVDVRYSHYVRSDVPVAAFILLGLLFVLRATEDPRLRWHLLAGAATGLAAATKYTGAILVAPLLVGVALALPRTGPRRALRNLGAAVAASALAFTLASPYSVVNARETLEGVRMVYEIKYEGQFGIARGSSWVPYLRASFLDGPLPLFCLAGVVYAAVRRKPADLVLLSLVLPYLLTVAPSQSQSAKYLVPVQPVLALLASRVAAEILERWRDRPLPRAGVAVAFGAALASSLGASVAVVRDLVREDTRNAARAWIEENVPAGSTIALEWGGETVRLRESEEGIREKMDRYCGAGVDAYDLSAEQMCEALMALRQVPSERPAYRILVLGARIGAGNRLSTENMSLPDLDRLGADYVVTSAGSVEPDRELLRRTYPRWAAFYDELDAGAERVASFEEAPGAHRGPAVRVFKVRSDGSR